MSDVLSHTVCGDLLRKPYKINSLLLYPTWGGCGRRPVVKRSIYIDWWPSESEGRDREVPMWACEEYSKLWGDLMGEQPQRLVGSIRADVFANIFFHSIGCLFILLFPLLGRSFILRCSPTCLFLLLCLCFWCHIQEVIAKSKVMKFFPCSLLGVLQF